jgi:hypothetical protein
MSYCLKISLAIVVVVIVSTREAGPERPWGSAAWSR